MFRDYVPPNEPLVVFNLNAIEIWCVIKDIDKKFIVLSQLNLAITKACLEKNIELKV